MLERQQHVEVRPQIPHYPDNLFLIPRQAESLDHLAHLHLQLHPIEELHHKYTSYQYAYNKLVLELARRRQYREAAQRVVANTIAELDAMVAGQSPWTLAFCVRR